MSNATKFKKRYNVKEDRILEELTVGYIDKR